MSYSEGERLIVTVDGEEREVTLETVTAVDRLLLVNDGEQRFTAGMGEVTGRELTFGVYPDGPESEYDVFAVMNQERSDIPVGTLAEIQEHVNDAVDAGELPTDEELPEAGRAMYEPGKASGEVLTIELTD